MPKITLEHVTKRFDKFVAVEDLNMVIDDRSFITLLGPSGCGKTTTLRMIAGLETPTEGRITIGDTVVFDSEKGVNIAPGKRDIGFLFQNYALWPHMTVYQNIHFGLENVKEEKPVIDFEARVAARMIEILNNWQDVVDKIKASKDEDGKFDEKKAYLALIDGYTISMYTAKKLVGYNLHNAEIPQGIATKAIGELTQKIEQAKANAVKNGMELNENFEFVKAGEVVKKVRKLCKEEMDLEVRRVARILKIGIFMHRYPAELSGGQQQRVAIARTLATSPKVLFMDEPLSNLDAKLRMEMRTELKRLHAETDSTFVYVTHDQLEAMTLATKVCLMSMGHLQQYDPPLDTYNYPNNLFVADFVGNPTMNFINGKAKINGSKADVEMLGTKFTFEANDTISADGELDVVVGVRPEFLRVEQGNITGKVYATLPTGMETTVKIAAGDELLTAVVFGGVDYPLNADINYEIVGKSICLFDKQTTNRIGLGTLTVAGAEKPAKAPKAEATDDKPAKKTTAKKSTSSKTTTKSTAAKSTAKKTTTKSATKK
ncbi:MAG: ABC transporter ATP-binding protein [Clostridia bacterium]|nr:ABC transporter ATP-binding protein [Clostridia bacterium]